MLVMFFIFSMMIHNGPVNAGDYKMESNLNDLSELMDKWSKQLSSGKMDPKAQAKLSELLARTSEVLQELSAKKSGDYIGNTLTLSFLIFIAGGVCQLIY